MLITKIYKELKDNLPTDKFELSFEGDSFDIVFKDYDENISIMVCEEWCIPCIPNKAFTVRYSSDKINIIIKQIVDVMIFLNEFARYMENYVIDNTPKYGLVRIIQGGE